MISAILETCLHTRNKNSITRKRKKIKNIKKENKQTSIKKKSEFFFNRCKLCLYSIPSEYLLCKLYEWKNSIIQEDYSFQSAILRWIFTFFPLTFEGIFFCTSKMISANTFDEYILLRLSTENQNKRFHFIRHK